MGRNPLEKACKDTLEGIVKEPSIMISYRTCCLVLCYVMSVQKLYTFLPIQITAMYSHEASSQSLFFHPLPLPSSLGRGKTSESEIHMKF